MNIYMVASHCTFDLCASSVFVPHAQHCRYRTKCKALACHASHSIKCRTCYASQGASRRTANAKSVLSHIMHALCCRSAKAECAVSRSPQCRTAHSVTMGDSYKHQAMHSTNILARMLGQAASPRNMWLDLGKRMQQPKKQGMHGSFEVLIATKVRALAENSRVVVDHCSLRVTLWCGEVRNGV